jgi:pilus assembly protein Flp/PilA
MALSGVTMRALAAFWTDTSGATAIEYAVIAAGIGSAIVVAVGMTGTAVLGKFEFVRDKLTNE